MTRHGLRFTKYRQRIATLNPLCRGLSDDCPSHKSLVPKKMKALSQAKIMLRDVQLPRKVKTAHLYQVDSIEMQVRCPCVFDKGEMLHH